MGLSVRPQLIAGAVAVAAAVLVIPPSVPTTTQTVAQARHADVRVSPRIELTAAVRQFIAHPPSPRQFAEAKAVLSRIDPEAGAATTTRQTSVVPAAAPVTLTTASGTNPVYQFIQPWVEYGVALTTYVLQFIPYGYLISDQVNIFYYNLIQPISESIVYGLINPVLSDPLNPASYVNGFITVGQTAINAAINTGIAELNNFFGWLIPPLPPLPLATARALQPEAAVAAAPTAKSEQPHQTVLGADHPDTPPTTDAAHQPTVTSVPGTTPTTTDEVTDATGTTQAPAQPADGTSAKTPKDADVTTDETAPPKTTTSVAQTSVAQTSVAQTSVAQTSVAQKKDKDEDGNNVDEKGPDVAHRPSKERDTTSEKDASEKDAEKSTEKSTAKSSADGS